MYRPTLILRRFGPLSFGLGYFEDGAWVDHTTIPDGGRDLEIAGTATAAERRAVHELLDCCATTAVPAEQPLQVATLVDDRVPTGLRYRAGDTDVDAVARRSSAR